MSSNRTQMTPVSDASNATLWKEVEYDLHATCIVHSRRALDTSTRTSREPCRPKSSTLSACVFWAASGPQAAPQGINLDDYASYAAHSVEACCAPASTPMTATPRTMDSAPAPATRQGCGLCSTSDTWQYSETRRRLRSADQISDYPPSATASNSLVMKDLRRRRATCKLSFTPGELLAA